MFPQQTNDRRKAKILKDVVLERISRLTRKISMCYDPVRIAGLFYRRSKLHLYIGENHRAFDDSLMAVGEADSVRATSVKYLYQLAKVQVIVGQYSQARLTIARATAMQATVPSNSLTYSQPGKNWSYKLGDLSREIKVLRQKALFLNPEFSESPPTFVEPVDSDEDNLSCSTNDSGHSFQWSISSIASCTSNSSLSFMTSSSSSSSNSSSSMGANNPCYVFEILSRRKAGSEGQGRDRSISSRQGQEQQQRSLRGSPVSPTMGLMALSPQASSSPLSRNVKSDSSLSLTDDFPIQFPLTPQPTSSSSQLKQPALKIERGVGEAQNSNLLKPILGSELFGKNSSMVKTEFPKYKKREARDNSMLDPALIQKIIEDGKVESAYFAGVIAKRGWGVEESQPLLTDGINSLATSEDSHESHEDAVLRINHLFDGMIIGMPVRDSEYSETRNVNARVEKDADNGFEKARKKQEEERKLRRMKWFGDADARSDIDIVREDECKGESKFFIV